MSRSRRGILSRFSLVFSIFLGVTSTIGAISANADGYGNGGHGKGITVAATPSSSFGGSAGGDAWTLGFSSSQVFLVFHNGSSLQMSCRNELDASICAGWGTTGVVTIKDSAQSSATIKTAQTPSVYFDEVNNYVYTWVTETYGGSTYAGVMAFNTSLTGSPGAVGTTGTFTPLTGANDASSSGTISNAVILGGRWYAFNNVASTTLNPVSGTKNTLMCFDFSVPSAPAKCTQTSQNNFVATFPSASLGTANPGVWMNSFGSQLIIQASTGSSSTAIACVGVEPVSGALSNCSGWGSGITVSAGTVGNGAALPFLNSFGAYTGFCFRSANEPCYDLATGATLTTPAALKTLDSAAGLNSDTRSSPAAVVGTRVIFTTTVSSKLEVLCFDFSTSAACTGSYTWTGVTPPEGGSVGATTSWPTLTFNSTQMTSNDYSVALDPYRSSCVWIVAHGGAGQIANVDAFNTGSCSSGGQRALVQNFVVPTPLCKPTGYDSLTLSSPLISQYATATATIETASGTVITNSTTPVSSPAYTNIRNGGVLPFINGVVTFTSDESRALLDVYTTSGYPQFVINFTGLTVANPSLSLNLAWQSSNDPSCSVGGIITPPMVNTTGAVTSLAATSATLNGTVTTSGTSATSTFCVSTSSAVVSGALSGCLSGIGTYTGATTPASTTGAVSAPITGLTSGTTYYYQIVSVDGTPRTVYGQLVEFRYGAPQLITNLPTNTPNVNYSTSLNGTVTDGGSATVAEFCISTSPADGSGVLSGCLTTDNSWSSLVRTRFENTPAATTSGSVSNFAVSNLVSHLVPGTTYYYQLIGTSGGTTYYANVVSFVLYSVTYHAGTANGTAPVDNYSPYVSNSVVSVLSSSSLTTPTNFTADGWCTTDTSAAGRLNVCTGTHFAVNNTFSITHNVDLYSQWSANTNTTVTGVSWQYVGGQWVMTISVRVAAVDPSVAVPTGQVLIDDGTNGIYDCTATLSAGVGSCSIAEPSPGTFNVTAEYANVPGYNTSTNEYPSTSPSEPPAAPAPVFIPQPPVITFMPNGGAGFMSPQVFASQAELSPNSFTYAGFVFTGWSTEPNGSGMLFSNQQLLSIGSSMTLYAQWKPIVVACTVFYNANGGSVVPTSGTCTPPAGPLTLPTPSYSGFTFTGWNTIQNSTGSSYAAGASFSATTSTTLYAQWKQIQVPVPVVATPKPLGVIYFLSDSYSVAGIAKSLTTLQAIANVIKSEHLTHITLTASTDLHASSAYNNWLSAQRATSTKIQLGNLLAKLGVKNVSIALVPIGISTKSASLAENRQVAVSGY